MMKRIFLRGFLVLVICLFIQSNLGVSGAGDHYFAEAACIPATQEQSISVKQTEHPAILMNGNQISFNGMFQEGELYLPLRGISEILGYKVNWSPSDRIIGIDGLDKSIFLNLNEMSAKVDKHEYNLSYSPFIIEGRTYMKTDFFGDNLRLKMQWDEKNNLITLTSIIENPIKITTIKTISETDTLKTTVKYPVIEGLADANVQTWLNSIFKMHGDNGLAEGRQNATELALAAIPFPDRPKQCETYVDYHIKYNQKNRLSVILTNYQYSGGAHGATTQTAYTVDLEKGRLLSLQDLFNENSKFKSIIDHSIRAQLEERGLTSVMLQPFDGINDNQKYFLTSNGIEIYFDQYEILPYAAGIPSFFIDYLFLTDELRVGLN